MKRNYFLLFFLLMLSGTTALGQSRPEISKLESLFGKVVAGTDNVFEFNGAYAVRLNFDETTGFLIRAEIAPKYYFNDSNPAWTEEPAFDSALSRSDYKRVIDAIGSLVDLGRLRATSSVAVLTNLKARIIDIYENAVIERSQRDTSKFAIYSAKIWFMRDFSGTIEDITKIEIRTDFFLKKVKIGNCWYWTPPNPIKKGEELRLKVAGPIDDFCWENKTGNSNTTRRGRRRITARCVSRRSPFQRSEPIPDSRQLKAMLMIR